MIDFKRLPACFLALDSGREPVREWLLSLDDDDRRRVGQDIATVEFGWPVGMPVCKSLGGGLWEIRSNLQGNKTARVIFAPVGGRMVLLHGFIKKTQKTPRGDLALALRRLRAMR